jgi:hypothetical protein
LLRPATCRVEDRKRAKIILYQDFIYFKNSFKTWAFHFIFPINYCFFI